MSSFADTDTFIQGFIKVIQSSCNEFNSKSDSDIRYISQRSTEPIIEAIESLCSEIFNCIIEIDWKYEETINSWIYNYLIYFTNFKARGLLQKNCGYAAEFERLETQQMLISPYMLIEILWSLHYDAFLCEFMIHFPVNLCAEVLEVLPKCILMLDFSRATKFISTMVPYLYKKLDHMCNDLDVSNAAIAETRKLVSHLCEIVHLFKKERFMNSEGIRKLDIHKRQGIVLKALARTLTRCLKSEHSDLPEQCRNGAEECTGPSDSLLECREDIHKCLISILISKVQEVDCNCYMDWTEFDDEEQPALSLQRAIGIECHHLLRYSAKALGGKSYELLVKSIQQITVSSLKDAEYEDKNLLNVKSVHSDLLQNLLEVLVRSVEEGRKMSDDSSTFSISATRMVKVMAKRNIKQLLDFMPTAVLKILGKCERRLNKLNFECYPMRSGEDGFLHLDENDPLNLLLKDPERRIEQEYKDFLKRLIFQPSKTIVEITKLAIGHGNFDLVNLSYENIDLILNVLKIPVPNTYKIMLDSLMAMAGVQNEEKVIIVKHSKNMDRPSAVPLAVQALQKIAIDGFSSCQPHLSIYLKTLVDKNITSKNLLVEEFFLPLLLLPSCTLDPVLTQCKSLENLDKPIDQLYHQLLVRLLKKLPRDGSIDRYHVSTLLSQVHDLLEHAFNEVHEESISCKYRRFHYTFMIEFDSISKDYPEELLSRDILRHEMLYASQRQCFRCIQEFIASRGSCIGLLNKSEPEVFDVLVQTVFEACLLSLEFPEYFPQKTLIFVLELMCPILWSVKKKDATEICRSLNIHQTILADVMEKSPLSEHWKKLASSWQLLLDSKNVKSTDDLIRSLEEFINRADDLSLGESEAKSPLAIQIFTADKIISHLDSMDVAFLLNDNVAKCFNLQRS
ncbi:uncharacterized protein LOC106647857 [Copidosoma floridanum]|uniref:uncharacterized protein LOC106647857 n=1 Tax=Copidosoma floridanum TaxID=29053 RepID=UPI0006C98C22|nr:uncharacterized protein LOC106647857 [Copidosoma floridanum]